MKHSHWGGKKSFIQPNYCCMQHFCSKMNDNYNNLTILLLCKLNRLAAREAGWQVFFSFLD